MSIFVQRATKNREGQRATENKEAVTENNASENDAQTMDQKKAIKEKCRSEHEVAKDGCV